MPSASRPSATPGRKSKLITLSLPSGILSRFPASSSSSSSGKATPSALQESSESKTPEDNSTPIPANGDVQDSAAATADKKKRPPPNPNARKRAPPAIDPDAPIRAPRPPQKKKARLDNGTDADDSKQAATNAANAAAAHKLGPKANTGAINAGLRALDRSGKPCRRWEKKGLQLKSFTGSSWNMPTWKGHSRPKLNADGEVQSDSSSDVKPTDASALVSDKSASAIGETTMMTGMESSPAPAIAV